MKSIATLLLLSLFIKPVYSQTPVIDTLKKQLLSNSLHDTERVLLLSDLAGIIAFVKPDSALIYSQEGVRLAQKIGFIKGEMHCKGSMGSAMWIAGEYSEANKLLLQTLKYAKSIDDSYWQVSIYRDLSANNRDEGNYQEAVNYSYKATELVKSDKSLIADSNVLALCYLETGAAYEEMYKLDSALYYLQRVNLSEDANAGYTGFKFLMIGRTYTKMGDAIIALRYYKSSIDALAGTNNYKDAATVYNDIAKLYKKGKADSCIYYAKKGFDIAKKGSFKKGVYETSLLLSEMYEKKDPNQSLRYLKIAIAAKDSMFNMHKTTQFLSTQFNEQLRQQELQQRIEQSKLQYKNRLNIYILLGSLFILLIVAGGLWRRNIYRKKSFILLQKQKQEIDNQKQKVETTLEELKSTQSQLIQSEKMASLGELTAGIAHEIQNPLNFVNNFSDVNKELIQELNAERRKPKAERDEQLENEILNDLEENEEKINHHGKRADAIVKGMLQHSRQSSGQKEPTDINALADEYLRLSYHGLRAKDKNFNVTIETDFDNSIGKINLVPQDIGRVLLNLFNNAFYAVSKRQEAEGKVYGSRVSVRTKKFDNHITITVSDNGNGIPQKIIDKIFQPFFTTKPTGEGTGLGLSLSYDIVKAHGGEIKVESKEGEGSEFVIQLAA